MHEMSIAMELLDTVLAVAAEHHAASVEEVVLQAGVMKLIVPEALEMAWTAATAGTVAEGSRLNLTEIPLKARCRRCACEFQPEIDRFACPGCGEADVDIIEGDDIILRSMTCRTEEGASAP